MPNLEQDGPMVPFAVISANSPLQSLPFAAQRWPADESVPEDERPVTHFATAVDALYAVGFRPVERCMGRAPVVKCWEFGTDPVCEDGGAHLQSWNGHFCIRCQALMPGATPQEKLILRTVRCIEQLKKLEASEGNCPECGHGHMVVKSGSGKDPNTGYVDCDFGQCPECGYQEEL